MKPLKIIHTADIHFSRENQEKALASLETVCETAEREEVDLIVIAGDLFDRPVQNTESAGFPQLLAVIQRMMNIAPVVAVRGTPTHDAPGCYEPFTKIDALNEFFMLSPHNRFWNDEKFIVFGIPELGKEWFLKDKQLGKEDANEEIKRGMRELLLGLGAKRKEYPDIPCILIYHGVVAGASLSENQVLPAGGIQIGRDDLALVGADYIALGHIHMAQQIQGISAYYAGSAFPVDWGEMDQKSCNLVTIYSTEDPGGGDSPWSTKIETVSFPHPPRKKIICNWHSGDEPYYNVGAIYGFQTWLMIRKPKDALLDVEYVLAELLESGALPGSRVTTEIIPTETVRAGEIQNAVKLRDKVQIYAANSQEKSSDSILEKADLLEGEARSRGEVTEGLHVRIKKLVLRGAIGILKGTGRDQVEIDFAQYDPGLVALVGVNGSGKTTLIENMHPYPQMLTRSGKLQDHFCLRDSFRDLTFTDEKTGDEYRAFIQIDGANKSGGAEYFLYKNGEPITNGRKDDYEEKILRLFGSLPLYLRSAFVSQRQPKNLPDLSDATKGEKKALFRELGGLDYLQLYSESAKAKAQGIAEELIGIRAKVEREKDIDFAIGQVVMNVEAATSDQRVSKVNIEIATARGFLLKKKSEALVVIVKENSTLRTRMEGIKKQIAEYDREGKEIAAKVREYEKAIGQKDAVEKGIAEYETLKAEEAKLNEERARINEEKTRILTQYQHDKDAVAVAERALQDKRADVERAAADLKRDEALKSQEANRIEKDLARPVADHCPTCGQVWPTEKLEAYRHDRSKQAELMENLKIEIFELGKSIAEKKREHEAIGKEIAALPWPAQPVLPLFDERSLSALDVKILKLDISTLRETQAKLAEASVRIEEGKRRVMTLESQRISKEAEYQDCLGKIDSAAEAEYETVQQDLETARADYVKYESELAKITATIEHLQKEKTRLEAELAEIGKLKTSASEKEQHRREWEYLQRACGPDGIQALELDALGPTISEIANTMLSAAYNSRFQIEFRTTRIGGSGAKVKQIEDFQIVVHDSTDGSEQLLETLSGGESVWIKRAIFDSFAIARDRKTGQRFLTVFADEADGALDPEARMKYITMIERAHNEAGRTHTIIVTHSTEIQDFIAQKIMMERIEEAVAVH